jgi:hypothetical protein
MEDDELRKTIVANADVKRGVVILREMHRALPDKSGAWTWAMLRHFDPEIAEEIARRYQENNQLRLAAAMQEKFQPLDASLVLLASWDLQMVGRFEQAKALLARYVERGLPVP